MKIRLLGAMFALVYGLGVQVTHAELVDFGTNPGCAANAVGCDAGGRIDSLEKQVAALQAQLGNTCGQESCGTWSAYAGAELVLLDPQVGSPVGFFGPDVAFPDYNFVASPRIWLGIENPEGLGVRATFWTLDATATSDSFPLTTGVLARTLDFDVTQTACLGHLEFQFAGGVRYGKIGQSIDVPLNEVDRETWEFEGFGPTLATHVRRAVGDCGLALVGGVRGSWLFGDSRLAASSNGREVDAASIVDQSVMVWDGRIGVEWARTLARGNQLRLTAAYEAQTWQGVNGLNGLYGYGYGLLNNSIGFVGPVFGLEFVR